MKALILPFLLIISLALIVVLQYGFIFLLLALLPSLVAYFIDTERDRGTFKVVFACNIAATLPSLTLMIRSVMHSSRNDVFSLMGDAGVWLLIYGGAAAGWCLIYLCNFIARFIVTIMYEYNITTLEGVQKELIDEWGQQIRQPPDNKGQ